MDKMMERTSPNGKDNLLCAPMWNPWNGDRKKTTRTLCLTSALPYLSSGGYALPMLSPTNRIYWHQDLPSSGPITSHPSQHHWGTCGECSSSATHYCAVVASPWGVPPSAWNNGFHKWLIHFAGSNISTSRKYGRYWGSYPTGKRPRPSIFP